MPDKIKNIDQAANFDHIHNIDQIAHQIAESVLSKIEMQVALLGALAAAILAILQFFLNRTSEKRVQLETARNTAYVDYIRAVAKSAHGSSPQEKNGANLEAAEAKTRITIYGTAKVVYALANFEKSGAALINEKGRNSFLHLVNSMRLEGKISDSQLSQILFGKSSAS